MEQFDRENSSNYVQQTNPTDDRPAVEEHTPAPTPVQPVEPPKPRRSKAPLVLTLLLLLALLGAAAFGWLWYQRNGRVDNLEADLSSARNKITQLESTAKAEAALKDDSVTTDTTSSESEAAIKEALAYAQANVNTANSKLTTQVMYIKDGFANVSVSPSQGVGGTGMILKQVEDQWVVVFSGQDNPPQEVVDMYGIPKAVLMLAN